MTYTYSHKKRVAQLLGAIERARRISLWAKYRGGRRRRLINRTSSLPRELQAKIYGYAGGYSRDYRRRFVPRKRFVISNRGMFRK